MDISIIANLGVAFGTILLAFFTFLLAVYTNRSIKSSQKQLKILEHQNRVIKNQQNPFLQVNEVKFNKNIISFKVENVGLGNAYEVGVFSYFQPVLLEEIGINNLDELSKIPAEYKKFLETSETSQESKYDLLNNLYDEGKLKDLYPNLIFNYYPTQLVDIIITKNNRILDNGYVTFPDGKYTNLVIKPNEHGLELTCEPKYCVCYFETKKLESINSYAYYLASKGETMSRYFNFDELIKIMTTNNICFFNLIFKLTYKNQYEEMLESVSLRSFVFSIKEHRTLEEAFKQGLSTGEFLSHRDLEGKLRGIPYYQYSQEKLKIPIEN